jgi:hypothetical protein
MVTAQAIWVSCPQCVKYYSKLLPAAPMALEQRVHSLLLPSVSRGTYDPIHGPNDFRNRSPG